MADINDLLARRDYDAVIPLLAREIEKYPTNMRVRLKYADSLAGANRFEDALVQYELIAKDYDEDGLIVQAIAVRKKAEKVAASLADGGNDSSGSAPVLKAPESPLFEALSEDERKAVVRSMELREYDEGDIVITEGEAGSSMYVIASGGVKVFTRGRRGENVHLATLEEGEFFGEISLLTGKARTATITASEPTRLLEWDKQSFDDLSARMPRVREVLEQFYQKRVDHTVEAMIDSMKGNREG